jgi:hypothetical protein
LDLGQREAAVWVIHHCLAWGSSCQPQSWADLGELCAGVFLALAAFFGSCIALLSLG